MPTDELTKPLGLTPPPPPFRPRPVHIAGIAVIAAIVVGGGIWLTRGAGPTATATIATTPAKPAVDTATLTGAVPARPPAAPSLPVVIGGPSLAPVAPTASLTEVDKVRIYDPLLLPAQALTASPDASLVENGTYGPLPKVAANGVRPLDAYARPAAKTGGLRIAIVVGGVGLDPATTHDAIAVLPGPVTLALAPYGDNLKQTLSDARASGHELLLQLPLEPYGYPKTDPGPHTLIAAATAKTNLDNLSWLLSRTTNYVGVMNYMGAAFTTTPQPMQALMEAVGKRGLLYLDDGSSPRSLAGDAAAGRTPFLKADLVLDPDLAPAAIDARLDQLIAIARTRGFAVGSATAFPSTIERIAAFAKAAAARDITLVPVSALVAAPRS
jgi:polysaccharide deacetylase 2 family uncharacterized protein YibQ